MSLAVNICYTIVKLGVFHCHNAMCQSWIVGLGLHSYTRGLSTQLLVQNKS